MRTLALFASLLLAGCTLQLNGSLGPGEGRDPDFTPDDDDDDLVPLSVEDAQAGCGPTMDPPPEDNLILTSPSPGVVTVFHLEFATGCCPEFGVNAFADLDTQEIVAIYTLENDFCDCICELSASFELNDVPAGVWTVILPENQGTISVE